MQHTYKLLDTDAKADLCKAEPNVFVLDSEYKGGSQGQRFQIHQEISLWCCHESEIRICAAGIWEKEGAVLSHCVFLWVSFLQVY